MDRREQYPADLPYRVDEDADGSRSPPPFFNGALKALSDVLTMRGRIVLLPSGQWVDLAGLRDAALYLLSRGFIFQSSFQDLAVNIQTAARQAAPPEHAEVTEYDAHLEVDDAVHDLDRAMHREFHKAEETFLQLQIWLSKVAERTDISLEHIFTGPDARTIVMKLRSIASAHLGKETTLGPHDSQLARLNEVGCGMPAELANRIHDLPPYAAQQLELKIDGKYCADRRPAQIRARPR